MPVPARIGWAVELLDVEPDDEIIEFGCGPGVAAHLVADQLRDGCITAIDRSATAIERAEARNANHIADGRAVFRHIDLAGFDGDQNRFDKAFGVNVNVFWTSGAEAECETLARVLRPGGRPWVVYDSGPSGRSPAVAPGVAAKLARYGFGCEVVRDPTDAMVCVAGRLGG